MEWLTWWVGLCGAALANAVAWLVCARSLRALESRLPAESFRVRKQILLLSGVYVLGCGFRSVLPMVDVPRICLHDTWISRIVVGRSIATVAELAFAAQWALIMREAGAGRPAGIASIAARLLVPVVVAAETFSWAAVLTKHNLLHAIENALWTLDALIVLSAFITLRPTAAGPSRRFIEACIVGAAAYIAFMVSVDVPIYLAVPEGWRDVLARCVVTRDWAVWRQDALWLSLYFTVAVWASIALAHAPSLRPRATG
jgi:hypothetical protein